MSLATTAVSAAGVLIAYQALGGRPETDVSFGLRVVGAFVTSLVVGVVVLVGLVALVIPGIYIGVRLLLAVPAVVVDGHGPIRALSVSWRAMGGSVLATFGASVAVFVTVFVAIVVLVVLSPFFASVAAVALAGSLFSGLQAFVYLRSRGEYDPLR